MKRRLVIAWELGGNLGHIRRIKHLADLLNHCFDEITLVLKDLHDPNWDFADFKGRILQAPFWRHRFALGAQPESHADILLNNGYANADSLSQLIRSWTDFYTLLKPDLVVLDYAPTANLAAKSLGVPTLSIGPGFHFPPAGKACPLFNALDNSGLSSASASEERTLQSIRHAFKGNRQPEWLADCFHGDITLLSTFAELDHYPNRRGAKYIGPLGDRECNSIGGNEELSSDQNCFVYLYENDEFLIKLFDILGARNLGTIGYCPNTQVNHQTRSNCFVSRKPLNIQSALSQSLFTICHGGATSVAASLKVGRPIIVVPRQIEQQRLGKQLASQGLGLCLSPNPSAADLSKSIDICLSSKKLRDNVMSFCVANRGYNPERQEKEITNNIKNLLRVDRLA